MTLNNQLVLLDCKEGDKVRAESWEARVYMNEFGLGLALLSSHDPQAICDGLFPEIYGLKKI